MPTKKLPDAIITSDLYNSLDEVLRTTGAQDMKDDETTLADALAGLMYWAEANEVDWDEAMRRALGYYEERI